MKMLIGSYYHNIDSKGRISIPSNFRKQLDDQVVLTVPVTQDALMIVTEEDYEERFKKFSRIPESSKALIKIMRQIEIYSFRVSIDSHGRILIPEELRKKFNLNTGEEILILGRTDKIELWNKEAFAQEVGDIDTFDDEEQEEEILERFKEYGI